METEKIGISNQRTKVAMNMSPDDGKKLHIVMFPWLAFGHLIPYLELSKLLAQKGHRISFLSTPRNIQRLPKFPPDLASSLTFVNLSLPYIPNLPENAEATSDVPYNKVEYLKQAFDSLQGQLTRFLEITSPDWIIYDFAPNWLPPIVAKLAIPSAYFSIYPANLLCFCGPPSAVLNGEDPRTRPEHFADPPQWVPFPSNMVLRKCEITKLDDVVKENLSGVSDLFRMASVLQGCDVVVIRSCDEIEPEWLRLLKEILQKPVIPVGLLPPEFPTQNNEVQKDDKWVEISNWLDNQKKESVIYIAFGSEGILSKEETTKLALGLELSQLPFFWVLRRSAGSTKDSDMLPDGFEERTSDRGIIWREWAPQLLILGHSCIGGFLTHCGWSSIIESLGVGCPLVMLPLRIDQELICRMMEWKKISVEIPRNEEDGSFGKEAVAETLRMVIADKKGEPYRTNAKALRKVFGDKARHDRYFEDFAMYLRNWEGA